MPAMIRNQILQPGPVSVQGNREGTVEAVVINRGVFFPDKWDQNVIIIDTSHRPQSPPILSSSSPPPLPQEIPTLVVKKKRKPRNSAVV